MGATEGKWGRGEETIRELANYRCTKPKHTIVVTPDLFSSSPCKSNYEMAEARLENKKDLARLPLNLL